MPEQKQQLIREWWKKYKDIIIVSTLGVLFVIVVAQFLYPRDRMLPFAYVDNTNVGAWEKKDAAWELDKQYAGQTVEIYIGENDVPLASPKPVEIGLAIANNERISHRIYPWYMRLIPSSILWYEQVAKPLAAPSVTHDETKTKTYVNEHIGKACTVKPVNAKVEPKKDKLVIVPSQEGGTCKHEDVVDRLQAVAPKEIATQIVRIPVKAIAPAITDNEAQEFANAINEQVAKGVTLKAGDILAKFDAKTILSWLTISTENNKLSVSVSAKKAQSTLQKNIGNKVYIAPGITKVTTKDFTEVKRTNGPKGRQLNIQKTVDNLSLFVQGENDSPTVVMQALQPEVHYTRTYSKSNAGLSALMQHYAEDHKGTYGVQLIEIGGQGRRAGYNTSKQFTTASTYKLFVAYSTLKKVEAGKFKWSDQISGGRDLTKCFDDMIVVSDNACAEALIEKISHKTLQEDVNSLGLTNTTFSHAGMNGSAYATTASDLATFLAALDTGSMPLKSESRSKLTSAMRRNVHRQGIPAGTSATVANKVGFLGAILNDAAIVYSPKGTYVLAVMSDGASWGNIAEFTREIEKLR